MSDSILDMSIDDVVGLIEDDIRSVIQNTYDAGSLAGATGKSIEEHNLKSQRAADAKARIRNAVAVLAMRAKGI
tara:strand:- start:714 stop:935 length:222 start_codon:yes stop_codon:yes gene_type:complete